MEFRQGMRVYVEGDAAEICTADYTIRVSSPATVVDEPEPDNEYVLLSIDRIGADRNAWVYVRKEYVRLDKTRKENNNGYDKDSE